MKEPKIYQRKRYTANTSVARAVSELIEKYGGRLVLEAVADYCFQHLGLRWFAAGFGRAAEQLGSADDSRLRKSLMAGPEGAGVEPAHLRRAKPFDGALSRWMRPF